MTLEQCQSKSILGKKLLVEKLIWEAVVSSVTSLNNDVCLSVAVLYCSKVGKSGDNTKETFLNQIRLIQMCENCIVRTKDENMVLTKSNFLVCESYCDNCFTSDVCENPTGVLAICNPEFLTYIVNQGSLILCFIVLCLYLIFFVKQLFYRSLVLTKHFVEILTILRTFAL